MPRLSRTRFWVKLTWRWRRLSAPVRVLIGILVLGGALEFSAWLLNPQLPGWRENPTGSVIMQGHPTRLWGMTPGSKDNAGARATINTLGLRGEAPLLPRPEGRQRILMLGDSTFFGHGVGDDETLAVQLAGILQERGLDVDVVNGAVSGYSIAQSALLMEEIGWGLQPTLVLYANLWSDNTWDAFHDEDLLRSQRFARYNPLARSSAFRLLLTAFSAARPAPGGRLITWSRFEDWPEDQVRRVPVDRYAALTEALIQQGAAAGIGAALVRPTNTLLIASDAPDTRLWAPYFDAVEALGQCHALPVIDMTPGFRQAHRDGISSEALFVDLMHPTAAGQRLMAEAVADALLDAGWPARALTGSATPCDLSGLSDIRPPDGLMNRGAGSPQTHLFDASPSP